MANWPGIHYFQPGAVRCQKHVPASALMPALDRNAAGKHGWLLMGFIGMALLLTPQPMPGQSLQFDRCLESCFTVCDSGPALLADECRSNCIDKCQSQNRNQSQPAPYGAIAFGTRGAEGISWNKTSWQAAGQSAIATCSKYGSNCKVVYRYQNTCAALAVAKGGQHFESATGGSEKQAAASATALCKQHWGTCSSDLSACSLTNQSQVSRTTPSPAAPPTKPHGVSWGAIAYSAPDMKVGWSLGMSDRSLAEKQAMDTCSQRGKACVVREVFNKECGALAADRSFVGSATSVQPREAQQQAIEQCTKEGGENCMLHVMFCSY